MAGEKLFPSTAIYIMKSLWRILMPEEPTAKWSRPVL